MNSPNGSQDAPFPRPSASRRQRRRARTGCRCCLRGATSVRIVFVRRAPQSPAFLLAFASVLTASAVGFGQSRNAEISARQDFLLRLSDAALERTHHAIRYDPAYVRIPYPGGDVPAGTGVCTDEVIRSYRALGIDLQKEVHEDMVANFSAYPSKWRWRRQGPDSNIDHRRVPNLMVFFSRKGEVLPITNRA